MMPPKLRPPEGKEVVTMRFAMTVLLAGLLVTLPAAARPALAEPCGGGAISLLPSPSLKSLRSYRALLHTPGRVAVAGDGTLYLTDPSAGRILVNDRYGRLIEARGGFVSPLGIAVDRDGRIYVGELGKGSVSIFDQDWNLVGQLGRGANEFLLPNDIAIDSTGRIYVTDSGQHTVKVYYGPTSGTPYIFGGRGSGAGQFDFPAGIYVADSQDEVFVVDQNNYRVQVFDRFGTFKRCFGSNGSGPGKFGRIQGITGDDFGRLYVADAFQGTIQVLDTTGNFVGTVGEFGEGPGQLRTPMDLAIDPYNRLFVTSANNSRVQLFGLDGYLDPSVVPAVVDVEPNTLKRTSRRKSITAYIEIRDYSLNQVNVATVTAYEVPARPWPTEIGDHNQNGIPDLMVKFDAQALLSLLPDGETLIIVSGELVDGALFEGSAAVRVVRGQAREADEGESEDDENEPEDSHRGNSKQMTGKRK